MIKQINCKYLGQIGNFDMCRKCDTRNCMIPYPVIESIMSFAESNVAHPSYTATSLLGCRRKAIMAQRYDIAVEPRDMFYMWRGSMIHEIHEEILRNKHVNKDEVIIEQRFEKDVEVENGKTLKFSGQVDYVWKKGGVLYDWKTTKSIPLRPKPEHIKQMEMYKWLLKGIVDINIAYLCYLSFSDVDMKRVELRDNKNIEQFITDGCKEIYAHLKNGTLPENNCESWECDYCHYRSICESL